MMYRESGLPVSDHNRPSSTSDDQQPFIYGNHRFSNNRTQHAIPRILPTMLPPYFEGFIATCHSLTIHGEISTWKAAFIHLNNRDNHSHHLEQIKTIMRRGSLSSYQEPSTGNARQCQTPKCKTQCSISISFHSFTHAMGKEQSKNPPKHQAVCVHHHRSSLISNHSSIPQLVKHNINPKAKMQHPVPPAKAQPPVKSGIPSARTFLAASPQRERPLHNKQQA
jgi:hypothetical protein